MEYIIKRSRRRTIGLQIDGGVLIVRAPMMATTREIEKVIEEHRAWIERNLARQEKTRARAREKGMLTEEDIRTLAEEAKIYIPQRVDLYSRKLGVRPGRITIRAQKTRWGSCSAKGNLSFNCLLMLTPPEVIDSVVVHELCHIMEMNHSPRFYDHVLKVYPEYHRHHRWLRENGPEIMARAQEYQVKYKQQHNKMK